jgi:predicted dehydrogenase
VRALVVGLGHMGTFHRQVLLDLGYTVEAVDPRPGVGAEYRTTMEALLTGTRYDVAVVAVPAAQLVECAFELAGCPHLYVEKPFAPTAREAAMLGAYLTAQGPVCVGYVERFNPRVQDLKEQLRRAAHVRSARFIRWSDRPSGDPVTDLLTHDIDLARHLLADKWGERAVELCHFDYAANVPAEDKRRIIEMDVVMPGGPSWQDGGLEDRALRVDLIDHAQSPLHAIWHAFLTGASVPGPADAIAALAGAQQVVDRNGARVAA